MNGVAPGALTAAWFFSEQIWPCTLALAKDYRGMALQHPSFYGCRLSDKEYRCGVIDNAVCGTPVEDQRGGLRHIGAFRHWYQDTSLVDGHSRLCRRGRLGKQLSRQHCAESCHNHPWRLCRQDNSRAWRPHTSRTGKAWGACWYP